MKYQCPAIKMHSILQIRLLIPAHVGIFLVVNLNLTPSIIYDLISEVLAVLNYLK